MKVLFLLIHFPKLSETFILNQITGLVDRGVNVKILARKDNNESLIHPDVSTYNLLENNTIYYDKPLSTPEYIYISSKNLLNINTGNYKSILKSLKYLSLRDINLISKYSFFNEDFDIIHIHFGYNSDPGIKLKASGAFNGKLVTSFHGNDLGKFTHNKENPYGQLINYGDSFLPISDFLAKRLQNLGFPPEKTTVHKVGIDCEKFSYKQRPDNKNINIVSVGRFIEKKGFDIALKAVMEIIKKKELDNINFSIIGSGTLKNEFEQMVDNENMSNQIKFLGDKNHDEVKEILYDSDIFILPSYEAKDGDIEGIPTVLMEAMATGLPVISTFHSGIPELIKNNFNGLLCKEKDHEDLKNRITQMAINYDQRVVLAKNARTTVENSHNINKLNDNLINHYNSILSK